MSLIEELRSKEAYLSTGEVMKLLQVTRNTLCQWVHEGRVTAIRVGNGYEYCAMR
jgi:excisionase family DNA binding protein